MRFLGWILVFGGYTLIYSAVANHGRFSSDPWGALWADAYTTPLVAADQSVVAAASSATAAVGSTVTGIGL